MSEEARMRRLRLSALALAALLGLSACETENQTLGTGAGAVAGGVAGYLITGGPIGTIIGAAAGGVIGNRMANFLEGDSQTAAAEAAARAAQVPTGQIVTWKKSNALFQTVATGWASPVSGPYTDSSGRTCRQIREQATRNGQTREDQVRLCNTARGWIPG
jgi:osmotically inducible lipoprotein OsmB